MKSLRVDRRVYFLLPLLLFAGCAVGPNYKTPKTSLPPAFANGVQTNFTTGETVTNWWHSFNDSQLNNLIERSLTNNHDLRIATANLREARALRRFNQFDLLPAVNGNASYVNTRVSKDRVFGFPGVPRSQELYDVGFDASWELDFFGRVRRSIQASTAEEQASEGNRRSVQVSLVSEVARNYFELRGAQNELAVARRNAENQRETVNITQARLEGVFDKPFAVAHVVENRRAK